MNHTSSHIIKLQIINLHIIIILIVVCYRYTLLSMSKLIKKKNHNMLKKVIKSIFIH